MRKVLSSNDSINNEITLPEYWESTFRMASNAFDRLTIGPLSAISTGLVLVYGIGVLEGRAHLRPLPPPTKSATATASRTHFVLRYALAQVLPSVIWYTQDAKLVASHIGFDSSQLYNNNTKMPTLKALRIGRYTACRGAIAGSVLLSQVLSVTTVLQQSRDAYSSRIYTGKEPPLQNWSSSSSSKTSKSNHHDSGVVIRLSGIDSDVTSYSMLQLGRRKLWPIFEDPNHHSVQSLVRRYGIPPTKVNEKNKCESSSAASIPVFWQVDNGEYSKYESWNGMSIPPKWLFHAATPTTPHHHQQRTTTNSSNADQHHPLLVLEADATSCDGSFVNDDLDLDLKEAAQGFHRLAGMAPHQNSTKETSSTPSLKQSESQQHNVLRVLLVNEEAKIQSGGGRQITVRDFVNDVQIADITINARSIIVRSILEWLNTQYNDFNTDDNDNELRPVILETHSKERFHSIQRELLKHGYNVIDIFDVETLQRNNKKKKKSRWTKDTTNEDESNNIQNIPMLVYERTSADTISTIRAYVKAKKIEPQHVCALLSSHDGLQEVQELGMPQVGHICSSEIYHNAFEFVRQNALEGQSIQDIQTKIDTISKEELDCYVSER